MKKRLVNIRFDVNNEDTYGNAVAIVGILNFFSYMVT